MPTPARRTISSRLTSSPSSVKACLAASTSFSRLRIASARGFRPGGGRVIASTRLLNGGILHILSEPSSAYNFPVAILQPGGRWRPLFFRQEITMSQTFGPRSTTDEVLHGVDLRGKRVFVTGVSAGLGVETARVLAAHGAQVVGAARDLDKARGATEQVRAQAAHGGGLELVQLDLASLASVRACADALVADGRGFDLAIGNAGVMACPKGTTADGFETQFGTNHLGHFVLMNRIARLLKPGARLVNLSSAGHRFADVDLEDPNFERAPYDEWVAYGRSKTANILFAVEFDRRHKTRGVRATAVHPGAIHTELGRHMTTEVRDAMMASILASL